MDLMLQSAKGVDIMPIAPTDVDMAFGVGKDPENDMEITMPDSAPKIERGMYVYCEGTAYGGMLTGIASDDGLTWHGRTWFGLLASKVLVPDGGVGSLTVSGNANDVLRSLISRTGLTACFKVNAAKSTLTVKSHTFDKYQDALNGIVSMLSKVGGKLRIVHDGDKPVLSAVQAKDWSKDEAFDADQVDVAIDMDYLPVNHLVGRGEGQDGERVNVELYMDDSGAVSTTKQTLKGVLDNSEYYNYSSADKAKLIEDGTKKLQEYWADAHSVSVALDASLDLYDVGDTVGGTDAKTGIFASAKVTKKIVKMDERGSVTVQYETGAI